MLRHDVHVSVLREHGPLPHAERALYAAGGRFDSDVLLSSLLWLVDHHFSFEEVYVKVVLQRNGLSTDELFIEQLVVPDSNKELL